MLVAGSPVVALNHAVAVAMSRGLEGGPPICWNDLPLTATWLAIARSIRLEASCSGGWAAGAKPCRTMSERWE